MPSSTGASGADPANPGSVAAAGTVAADELATVLANIGDVVLRYSSDGTVLWASDSLRTVLGWAPDEVVGTQFDAAPDPQSDPARRAILAAMAVHAPLVHTRALARHRDGSLRWMAGTTRMVWNDDGSLAFTVASVRDVTDEVSAQADLAAARAQLQATLDSSLDPQVLLKAVRDEQGRIVDLVYVSVNPAAQRYLGITAGEAVGQRLSERFTQHAAAMLPRYAEVIETGQPLVLDDMSLPSQVAEGPHFFDVRGVRVADALSLTWRDVTDRHLASQALAASERQARLLAENAADVVVRATDEGVIDWVSPSVQRVLGWTPEQVVGQRVRDLVHADDQERLMRAEALLDEGDDQAFEVRVRTASGDQRWMGLAVRPIRDDAGQVCGRVAGLHDIQAEHDVREALAESERKFRLMAQNASDVVFHTVAGILEWVSPSITAIAGWLPEDVVGLPTIPLWHPDDRTAAVALRDEAYAGRSGSGLLRLRTKAGDYVWLDVAIQNYAEPDGRVGAVGMMRDVSDRVAATRAREESERRYRLLAENSSDFVLQISPEGVIEWVSPSVTSVVGWQPEQMVGRSPDDFFPADEAGLVGQIIASARLGQPTAGRRHMRCADGSMRWVWRKARPVFGDAGNLVALVSAFRDVQAEVEAETALREAEQRYRTLVASLGTGVILLDDQGRILEANLAAQQILGLPFEAMRGRTSDSSTWRVVHADGTPYPADTHPAMLAVRTGTPVRNAIMGLSRPDGTLLWLMTNAEPIRATPGAPPDGAVASFADITELQEARRALAESEDRYRLLAENASDVVFRSSSDAVLEWVSPAAHELLGWQARDMVGSRMADLVHPDDLPAMTKATTALNAGQVASYEARFRRASGGYRWLAVTTRPVFDASGASIGWVGSCRDATDAHRAREALEYLATHDSLTTLLNRAELLRRLRAILGHEARRGAGLAVLFGDFDGLKVINDTFGHGGGDAVLVEVARRITAVLRTGDIVARIGGDEFVVALPGVGTVAEAEALAAKIHASLAEPLRYEGHEIGLALSLGIAMAGPGSDPTTILREADLAGYRAKRRGRNATATYDPALDRDPSSTSLRLADGFQDAPDVGAPPARDLLDRRAVIAIVEGLMARPGDVGLVALGLDPLTGPDGPPSPAEVARVMAGLAGRLRENLDPGQVAGWWGDGEFAVVLPAVDLEQAERAARRLRKALDTTLRIAGHEVQVSVSAGVAVCGSAALVAQDLLSDADFALLLATRDGPGGLVVFTPELEAGRSDRATLVAELTAALQNGEFCLAWQPIRSCSTGEILGREALIRWAHPTRGLLAPSDFLGTLLNQGMGVELAGFVIDQAAREWASWDEPRPWVAVNMSAPDIGRGITMRAIRRAGEVHGIPAEAIVVELTEQTLFQRTAVVEHGIELAQSGVRLALEDFGTGLSALGDLANLPIAILKLDRSLVATADARSARIARSLVDLAHSLGILTVAEGVETPEHLENARVIGADLAQGYLLGRPELIP